MSARLGAAGALVLATACAGSRGPEFPTSISLPPREREPASFAPDAELAPAAALLPARRGETRDVAALTAPRDPERATDTVRRFFTAVTVESNGELARLFASQAVTVSDGARQSAHAFWRTRFNQLDYTALAGELLEELVQLRTYTFDSRERANADGTAGPNAPDEVVVLATLKLTWTGRARLFADELSFRLRPDGERPGEYDIAEIAEDFRLP